MASKHRGLTERQINRLLIQAKGDEAVLRKAAIERARIKILAILKKENVTLADIAPSLVPRRSRIKAAPKYQHPTDPTLTWSGQGRPPLWWREQMERGVSPSHLLISAYAGREVKQAVTKAKVARRPIAKKTITKKLAAGNTATKERR